MHLERAFSPKKDNCHFFSFHLTTVASHVQRRHVKAGSLVGCLDVTSGYGRLAGQVENENLFLFLA